MRTNEERSKQQKEKPRIDNNMTLAETTWRVSSYYHIPTRDSKKLCEYLIKENKFTEDELLIIKKLSIRITNRSPYCK
jgi:hypothetical protein